MATYLNIESNSIDITNETPRFFGANLLNAGNCTMTHPSDCIISRPQAIKAGFAELASTPGFVPMLSQAHFIVEIDSISVGNTIGSATFRYGREFFDSSGLTYLGYGITTGTGLLLDSIIPISFYPGVTSPDFYSGDKWTFDIRGQSTLEKAFDLDRSTLVRSQSNGSIFSANLAQVDNISINALIIYDNNFTSGTQIVWAIGNELYTFSASGLGKEVVYLTENISYPYHTISVSGNDDNLEIGELYLGEYIRLDRKREIEHTRSRNIGGQFDDPFFKFVNFDSEKIEFSFPLMEGIVDNSDLKKIDTLFSSYVVAGYKQTPFFVHFNPTDNNDLNLFLLDNVDRTKVNRYINIYDVSFSIVELPKVIP